MSGQRIRLIERRDFIYTWIYIIGIGFLVVLAGMKLLCVETFMITIVMAAIYLLERIRFFVYEAKLKR